MARHFDNWLSAFLQYAGHTEAPKIMHTWSGVSAIAGALRRKVWIDQYYYRWCPNFYIVFVAPPGVVSKSTTADIALSLLRNVPGIKFGPDVVTWQSLVTSFAGACEQFEYQGDWHPMSAMTLVSSELGNLVNMQDKEMINLLIDLWDGRKSLEKQTKMSGVDIIEAPWINIIGCTTPHWIADNMPAATVGGGFTSRCVFIYTEKKEKFVAYPADFVPAGIEELRGKLIADLEHISLNLCGEYRLDPAAKAWGKEWYEKLWKEDAGIFKDEGSGYKARKQTHTHKLAMIISASQRDELIITQEDLMLADALLSDVEADMAKVFSRIGRSEDSLQAEKLIQFVHEKGIGGISYEEAYRSIHIYFPDARDFEGILSGAIKSGQVKMSQKGTQFWLTPVMV